MRCPFCGCEENKVIDSRPVEESNSIRRRRECIDCGKRFNTFEVVESVQLIVIKKSGIKELYDRQKLLSGVLKATQKRPVNAEEIINEIESDLSNSLRREVSSEELGELVMEKLKVRDEVAYVRFASVYREFKDVDTFLEALNSLRGKKKTRKAKS